MTVVHDLVSPQTRPAEAPAGKRVVLALRDARLSYGTRTLWSHLTLDVAAGEFIAVLGANGSGKTSLLKAILGLQPLSGGSLEVGGHPVKRGSGEIGYVPQQRRLDASTPLRARDVVRQGIDGHRFGLPLGSGSARARVDDALRQVGAQEFANMPVGLLSGGEQQRVRVAQALAADPVLLLCDEPLLSLDIGSQKTITSLIDQRRRDHDTAVVFVTHEINPVLPYVDRVLYLAGGRFRMGTVDEVFTSENLSELYGTSVAVVRAGERIIVAGVPETEDAPSHHVEPADKEN
ncbi:zinc/manganese transport system ATP-binding protein [Propionibacterium cyclohexanicum]|uniref:Zinc/manganese transport system ATP-binding protein n=1 Tax=Propionibacterium cyclohexanicum TaxID=64702 RepID=A0A1H9TKB7_9ACTN|nr:metal ABC transporter ATP-binding protein [Propionibacterium cyclohexanicum]SER97477.1 zinc/manganese transport system ATP-binding protein [Propionibacterium cyclohexanicum]